MSKISVNSIEPRTAAAVNITGLTVPTYLGQDLALKNEAVLKTGSTMTGPLILSGDATSPLQSVPKQQLDAYFSNRALSPVGYQVFPGGFTMQWFESSVADVAAGSGTNTYSAVFPIAFPNTCLHCYATLKTGPGGPINVSISITTRSTLGISFEIEEWAPAINPVAISFLAIGY